MRNRVQDGPSDLLDEVDLPRYVACPPGGHGHRPVLIHLEAELLESQALVFGCECAPEHVLCALRAETNDRSLGKAFVDVDVARHARVCEIDQHAAREHRGRLGEIRVDALFPTVRTGGSKRETLRGAQDADRLGPRAEGGEVPAHRAEALVEVAAALADLPRALGDRLLPPPGGGRKEERDERRRAGQDHCLQARLGGERWYHLDLPRHRVHFTPAGLDALLRGHGFTPTRTTHVLLEHNPFGMWQSLLNRVTTEPSYLYNLLKRNAPLRSSDLVLSAVGLPLARRGVFRPRPRPCLWNARVTTRGALIQPMKFRGTSPTNFWFRPDSSRSSSGLPP